MAAAVNSANIGVAQQYNLADILGTLPVAANDAAQVATSLREQRSYGLVLAGIAQEAQTLNVRTIDLGAALASDMTDGTLDGMSGATAITVPVISGGSIALPASAGTADLQTALDTFVASVNNQTNLTQAKIPLQAVPVGINGAGLFYTTTTVLPAWLEGQFGSATLSVTGGTPPYTWALKAGSVLPAWLSLGANGVIAGTPPIVGGMSIEAPFTVTVTDALGQQQDLVLYVTIVLPPPTLIPITTGACIEKIFCSVQVAQAALGTPPYYFVSDSFATGAPPLGMGVGLNGYLSGTPAKKGTYTFGVCVVDLVGATSCDTTSVRVDPSFDLTVTYAGTGSGAVTLNPPGSTYAEGTVVTLTATPDADSDFTGWSGACAGTGSCSVTMDADKSVTATFDLKPTAPCSSLQVAGADTPEIRTIEMGQTSGTFSFIYETFTQQDRMVVSYEGSVLFDTGCCGCSGTQSLSYSGTSTEIIVTVTPNCAGGSGTAWNFTVDCPL